MRSQESKGGYRDIPCDPIGENEPKNPRGHPTSDRPYLPTSCSTDLLPKQGTEQWEDQSEDRIVSESPADISMEKLMGGPRRATPRAVQS